MLIPDCARIQHKFVSGPEIMYVTHAVRYEAGIGATSLQDLAERAGDEWRENIIPQQSKYISHAETVAYDLGDPTAPVGVYAPGVQVGGANFPALPLNVAVLVTLRTAKRGKSYTGRFYVPGLPAGSVGNEGLALNDVHVTAFQTAFDAYKDGLDPAIGDSGKMVVASPKLGSYEDVIALQVRNYLGTQRRRLNAMVG